MKKSELRQLVINVIWDRPLYRAFCDQDIRARGIRVEDRPFEVSMEFISETLDKLLQKGAIQGRRLVVEYYTSGAWYKFLKDVDDISDVQKTHIAMHHDYILQEQKKGV